MSNAAHLLPARLRAAAEAIANGPRVRLGAPPVAGILNTLPDAAFIAVVDDARAALDAADAVDPVLPPLAGDAAALRIHLCATVGLDLCAQGVVILDVAQDGTVTTSTWTLNRGTPARALAEWARGLETGAVTVVPFRTVFGWGFGGVPLPLTPEERASLIEAGRAYADRNTVEPRP